MPPDTERSHLALAGKRVVLLLQGGGALGAYQVGAYTALAQACRAAGNAVSWVGGISIGALNAAVIAGPQGRDAAAELEHLWSEILSPPFPPFDWTAAWANIPERLRAGWLAPLAPKYTDWTWTAFNPAGQQNFFGSRVLDPLHNPWFLQWGGPLEADQLAFYDTAPLRKTLDVHVDWASINRGGGMRLSLGATRVRDGEVVFFNTFESQNPLWYRRDASVEQVLASSALPPAFPPIWVDGELYCDGGVSTNTPIEALAEELTAGTAADTIVFLVDLWDRKGSIPRSLDDLYWRQKSIAYGSRKDAAVSVVDTHQLEVEAKRIPPTRLDVCQVMLEWPHGDARQFAFADADFSQTAHAQLCELGRDDMRSAIAQPHRVPGVGGAFAALYRYGTHAKHCETDRAYAQVRERKQRRRSAYETAAEPTR
jgi:predicted acylesterase/phospholipase RssA